MSLHRTRYPLGEGDRYDIVTADPSELRDAARLLAAAALSACVAYLGTGMTPERVAEMILGCRPKKCLCRADALLARLLREMKSVAVIIREFDACPCAESTEGGVS